MPRPLAKEYRAVVAYEDGEYVAESFTNKRNAIRWCRKVTRNDRANTNGSVYAITDRYPNDVFAGPLLYQLLYQCHTDAHGKLWVDEL